MPFMNSIQFVIKLFSNLSESWKTTQGSKIKAL